MKNIPKISVLMITYNQENVVRRSLDSLIAQKEYIYEICINDDCSTDRTFDILKEYELKYPGLVKPVRNEHNLGIFQNIEETWKRPSGDIITRLAGDDESPNGYYKKIINFIDSNGIDYQNELFCIYCNHKQINTNGTSILYKYPLAIKCDTVKLHVRKLISNRGACYSKKVLDRFISVCDGRSYKAELLQEYQVHLFSEVSYYINETGNHYYAHIGISSKFTKKESIDSHIGSYEVLIPFLEGQGHPLDKKDLAFIDYMKAYRQKQWGKAFGKYIASIDMSLGIYGLQLHRIIFVLRNRMFKKNGNYTRDKSSIKVLLY